MNAATFAAYSKAITAVITSYAMLYLRSKIDLTGMGIEGWVLTIVQITVDTVLSGVVGLFTLIIPMGRKYWHEKILGQRVTMVTVNPATGNIHEVEGTVVMVNGGESLSPSAKADAIDIEANR